jgi:mevalonate kinase
MTSAFGKAILLGEHAVVYGHPALAGAIDATVRCAWRALEEPHVHGTLLRVRAPAWNLALAVESGAAFTDASLGDPERAVAALVHGLDAHLGVDVLAALGPGEIVLDTHLPAAAGLGSSASMAVAVTRALAEAVGRQLTAEEVAHLAQGAERCFHANPSGVDVALAAQGGLGLYYRGRGLEPVDAPPLRLAVGLTGVPRSTAVMVSRVAAAWEADRARVDDELATLGAAALAGAEAMRQGDIARLGTLMDGAHQILAGLGVSSVALDRLCDTARAAGALGAKLTGAGGGGAVIALGDGTDGAEEAIVAAWRAAGHDGFVCRVGARP